MNVLGAIFAWRQLDVVLGRPLAFHLNDLVSSVLTCSSCGGRDPCESGSIGVKRILIILCCLSLLSSDRLLRIESPIHKVDMVLIAWASINHVSLKPRVSIQLVVSKIE